MGADLIMGSLIKSPGGTLVTGGGYIAGKRQLISQAGARLTAPGVGLDSGAVPGETLRLMFQGKQSAHSFQILVLSTNFSASGAMTLRMVPCIA